MHGLKLACCVQLTSVRVPFRDDRSTSRYNYENEAERKLRACSRSACHINHVCVISRICPFGNYAGEARGGVSRFVFTAMNNHVGREGRPHLSAHLAG